MIDAVVRALSLNASDETGGEETHDALDLERLQRVCSPRATVGATETVALVLDRKSYFNGIVALVGGPLNAIYHDVVRKYKALESRPPGSRGGALFRDGSADTNDRGVPRVVFIVGSRRLSTFLQNTRPATSDRTPKRRERTGFCSRRYCHSRHFKDVVSKFALGGLRRASCRLGAKAKHTLRSNRSISSFVVDENEYSNAGTPDCLEKYLKIQGWSGTL